MLLDKILYGGVYQSAFTPAGSSGAPGAVIPPTSILGPGVTRTVVTVSMPLAATEYSYTFPADVVQYMIRLRNSEARLWVTMVVGQSGINYTEIPRLCFLSESGLFVASMSLYMQSPVAGQVAEITSWSN